ncbi:MAG: HAD family hydrolase [Lachnospiraceae bacterium]|nr:HAD family hydrolase [Lachnospiraceae bacterium]
MDRKVIFLDIDGTLTEPGSNEPPESAVTAICQARKKGNFVFLCTGRNYDMLQPLLKYGFDGVVASSGGYIICQEEVIYNCPMTEEQKQKAMTVLEENGIFRTIECKDGSYTDEGFKEFLREHAAEGSNSELLRWREQIEQSLNILPMKEYRGQPIYKIVIMSPSWEQIAESREQLQSDFTFCIQDEYKHGFVNGEIVNKKFHKGKAVERVCDYLKIPLYYSVAIGDSMNDKEMLETAGLSICMRNGSEELKNLADDICPSVQEGGIRYAFLKHHII